MSPPRAAALPHLSAEQLDAAFTGAIPRVWVSPLYLLGLVVVAVTMILLPLIYVGLIGLVGYGLYYHVTQDIGMLRGGMGFRWRGVLFLAPLVMGLVLVLFMIKPLFAWRGRSEHRVSLVRGNDPLLFEFMDRLCRALRAPKPRRIDVDCSVNASAGFRRGLFSLIWPADLVLTLGAPLVAGLTLRQLGGVLAHELGHFSQGFGMRLSYIIRTVNSWFARVVYARDAWDEWLIDSSETSDWRLVFQATRFFVWITRRILWALMMLGHFVSSAMMRQMEYNADLYEIRFAGSEAFEATMAGLGRLNLASVAAQAELAESWRDGRLPDDLPALLADRAQHGQPPMRDSPTDADPEEKTGLFDTHPSDASRIAQARKHRDEGVFSLESTSTVLFDGFVGLCQTVTVLYYQTVLGRRFDPQRLIPTATLGQRRRERQQDNSAASRYYQGCLSLLRPLAIDRYSRVFQLPPKECLARLKRARAALEKAGPIIAGAKESYVKSDLALAAAQLAGTLLAARAKINPKKFGMTVATPADAMMAQQRAAQERDKAAAELSKVEAVLRLRLECAIALLKVDQVAARVAAAERLRGRSDELLDTLSTVVGLAPELETLRMEHPSLRALNELFDEKARDDNFIGLAVRRLEGAQQRLLDLRKALTETPYPFEHADGQITLARYVLPSMPASNELTGIFVTVERVLSSLDSLYHRLMGELAAMAEQVEKAIGLEPLQARPTAAPKVDP